MSSYDLQIRLVLTGSTGVGKSCLLNQFTNGEFIIPPLTVGVDQHFHSLKYKDKTLKLQFVDTAGNHRFKNITRTYYKGVAGAIFVYDVTQYHTFKEIPSWLTECRLHCEKNTTFLLFANKADQTDKRKVSYEEGAAFARSHNMLYHEGTALGPPDIKKAVDMVLDNIFTSLESGSTLLSLSSGVKTKEFDPPSHISCDSDTEL